MGGTLPALVRAFAARSRDAATGTAILYGTNTLGAVAGTLGAGFFLLERFGVSGTLALASGTSLAIGLAALALASRSGVQGRAETTAAEKGSSRRPAATLSLVVGLSGFSALASEIAWNRLFAQFFENSVYSFAAVLAVFLGGIGLGSIVAGLFVARLRDPARELARLQAILALLVLGSIGVVAIRDRPETHDRLAALGTGGWFDRLAGEVAFAALTLLLPALASGAALPLAIRALDPGASRAGGAVGRLYASNTLGSVLGSLAAGFALLPALGGRGALAAAAGANALAAAFALRLARPVGRALRVLAGLAGAGAALGLFAGPSLRIWRVSPSEVRLVDHLEDVDASVAVVEDARGLRRLKLNNTYSLGGGDGVFQERRQGLLPALLRPGARSLLWIGPGTGNSLAAAAAFPFDRIEAVELVAGVARLARHFAATNFGVLDDPRVTVIVGDGRARLRRASRRYDLVVVDLLLPWEAGAGFLYTREFYASALAALAPGGLFAQWFPLHQMRPFEWGAAARTALEVFPRGALWIGYPQGTAPIAALLAAEEELRVEPRALEARLREAGLGRLGEAAEMSVEELLALFLAGTARLRERFGGERLLRDDDCALEFLAPRSAPERPTLPATNLRLLRELREDPVSIVDFGALGEDEAGSLGTRIAAAHRAVGRILEGHERLLRSLEPGGRRTADSVLEETRAYAGAVVEAPFSRYARLVAAHALTRALGEGLVSAASIAEVAETMAGAVPDDFTFQYHLGLAREHARDDGAAVPAFEAALALRPADLLTRLHLGFARFATGAAEAARPLLEGALRDPGIRPFHAAKARGVLALVAGDPNRAAAELETALRLRTGDRQSREWLARASEPR